MARFVIVATDKEPASRNIANKLIELGKFEKIEDKPFPTFKRGEDFIVWHNEELTFATNLSQYYEPECFVCLFRHLSKDNKPCLTVHATGNLTSEVRRTGNPYELSIANPKFMFIVLKNLNKYVPEGYTASYEATHHSPTNLKQPIMFVEIGSTEKEWNDEKAVEAVAKSILDLLDNPIVECTPCIGFGGDHYADKFTKKALEENMAFGHIIPNYVFENITEDVVQQAIDKTIGAKRAFLDGRSKGKEEDRKKILKVLEFNKIELEKIK